MQDVPRLRRRLLQWYKHNQRDLPWRRPGVNVYEVLVSEAMLQQTRVDVATPYFQRWLAKFPTVQVLASADEDDVLRLWAGLGYYARARNLHAASKVIARDGWPATPDEWRALPGIGPYTAAAVASIAQGVPIACVDGNVTRVIARLTGERGDVAKIEARHHIAMKAQEWLAPRRAGDWNQAMMELGATVCLPRIPLCSTCPVADACAAKALGLQAKLPRKSAPRPPREVTKVLAVVHHRGRILFVRPPTGLLAAMWTLPGGTRRATLEADVFQQTGVRVSAGPRLGKAQHNFSHRTWRMQVHAGRIVATGKRHADARWLRVSDLQMEALATATRVALAAAGIAAKPKTAQPSTPP